jgi:hypothetical protein
MGSTLIIVAIVVICLWVLKTLFEINTPRRIHRLRDHLKFLQRAGMDGAWISFFNRRSGRFVQFRKHRLSGQLQICAFVPDSKNNKPHWNEIEELARNASEQDIGSFAYPEISYMVVGFDQDTERAYQFGYNLLTQVFGLKDSAWYEFTTSPAASFDFDKLRSTRDEKPTS